MSGGLFKILLSIIIVLIVAGAAATGYYYILDQQVSGAQKATPILGTITKPPASFTLNLDNPDDELLVFDKDLLISGSTSPNLTILITSDTESQAIKAKPDGTFSTDFNLDPGVNNLKIIAFDENGEQRSAQRTIYYSKVKI